MKEKRKKKKCICIASKIHETPSSYWGNKMKKTDEKHVFQPAFVLFFCKWWRTILFCVQERNIPFCLLPLISHLNVVWKLSTQLIGVTIRKKKKFTRVTINLSALRGGREGEGGAIAEQQPLHLLGNSKRVKIRNFPSGINTVSQKTSVWDRKSLLEGYLALILNI